MALEKIGVEATIEGLSSFRRGIGQMDDDVRGFGRSADGIVPGLNSMGDSLLKIGGIAAGALVAGLAAATTGIIAFTGSGIKAAIDMEDQMGNIAAVMNTTKDDIQPLSDLIVDLGIDPGLKVTAEEAANAIELLARNGLTMQEILDGAARSTVLLANATGAEFGNAANIATDAMAIFNIEAKDMQGAVDGIVSVTTNSKFTIDDYSLALRNGGAAAAIMNVSMEDFNAVIATSADEMGSGMKAGTGFRNFLTRLTPASDKAAEAMQQLGLVTSAGTNMFFDANGQLKSMAEVSGILENALFGTSTAMVEVGGRTAAQNEELARLQGIYNRTLISIQDYETGVKGAGLSDEARANKLEDLQLQLANTAAVMGPLNAIQGDLIETTNTLTDAERSAYLETIFGADALGTAIALSKEGADGFAELAASMSETKSAAAALERMDSVAGVMEIISSVIDGLKLQIGQAFLPLIRDLADNFLVFVQNVGPKVVKAFENISGGISEFVSLLQDGESPLDAFFGGLEKGGISKDFIKQLKDAVKAIDDFVTPIIEFVKDHAKEFKGALVGIGAVLGAGIIVSVLTTIGGLIAALISPIGLLIVGFAALGAAISHFGGIQQIIENIRNFITETDFAALGQDLITKFLEGMSNLGESFGTWAGNLLVSITESINNIDWIAVGESVITFIGNAIAGAVGLIALAVTGLFNFFKGTSDSQDWASIGLDLLNSILDALSGFVAGVLPVLQGWYQSFISWVQSVDWLAIGNSIVTFVLNGLNNFISFVGETLSGWWTSFTTWVDSVDWVQIGLNIVMFVIEGLVNFVANVAETLGTWYQAFADWVESIDWKQIGYDIVTFIIDAFQFFNEEVPATLDQWAQNFVDWVTETDWKQMAINLIVDMVVGLGEFWFYAQPKIQAWWTSIKDWFDSIDWAALGQTIIDGVVSAITNGAAAIAGAIGDMIQGAIDAAKDALNSHSPSKVFYDIGTNIGLGLIGGINAIAPSVQESIAALFDIGGALGGIGGGFVNQLKNDILPELEAAVENRQFNLDSLMSSFTDKFGIETDPTSLVNAYFAAIHSGNTEMQKDIESIWRVQGELNGATAEYEQAQASIVALQKAQADLAFLEQQQKLLDLITENGLNAKDILGGLELGLGADTQGLVEAMTRAIQAIIEQANDQLQIASPSGVFKQIGKYITTGLAEGIDQTSTSPAQAMESMINRMVQPVQSQAAMPSVINQPSTTTVTKTAQVDMSGMQVGNEMDLQFLGDFILQKVSEAI